jgi:hypothetical protein
MARRNLTTPGGAKARRRASPQSGNRARQVAAASNVQSAPTVWTEEQISSEADKSLNAFVDRRLAESHTRYAAHLAQRRRALVRLFIALRPLNPQAPDPDIVRAILIDDELLAALRYAAGPPISEEDLGVLVTRKAKRLTKTAVRGDSALATDILKLICRVADGSRFPWLRTRRLPLPSELRRAIDATATLHASHAMQTERRAYGREIERQLRDRLVAMGYELMPTPNRGNVNAPRHMPAAKTFYGECSLYSRRADLLIGLDDGRTVAVEAKDSSSVKRVLNDTAAKARLWNTKMGEQVIPAALLSGVFSPDTLKGAQTSGLYLVWAHDLDSFANWLDAQ